MIYFLEVYQDLVLQDPLNIPHVGLLHASLVEVGRPLPEVVLTYQVDDVVVVQGQLIDEEPHSVRPDLLVNQHYLFEQVVHPKVLGALLVLKGALGSHEVEIVLLVVAAVVLDQDGLGVYPKDSPVVSGIFPAGPALVVSLNVQKGKEGVFTGALGLEYAYNELPISLG